MLDSHFHLFHMKKLEMPYMDLIKHSFDEGLVYALDIGINADNFEDRIKTAAELKGLYTAHGYYPSQCNSDDLESELEYLEQTLINDNKAVALGEIGLDFYHDYGSFELQAELVKRQINIANRLNLPVIIHSRNAEAETLKLLDENRVDRAGIIHCYSYSPETAQQFIDLGYNISFAGNVTYKNAGVIKESAAAVPLDSLLIETDAPYLSPQMVRGKRNHPGHIGYTYSCIAELRGIPLIELIAAVKTNFETLFRIS
ncbi:MAG: TatD family hydrolase [Spirochaetales bacterium]|uniref:TatD family hydrolase n=1 Tax=Candidatus Thalassospirochaeta sargassi TaxID=3119039 RepID=A0AAJ1IGW4_9SPIO|nr:TatD family hydrolase [Spirochaetales bacterium]